MSSKGRDHKRKLYHVPFKSPLVLTVDNCSQSTCTQSPTRSCTSLHINNANTPKLHLNQKTVKKRCQQNVSSTDAKHAVSCQTSHVKQPKTPTKGCKCSSSLPTTPKTPTVRPLNSANTKPCTTPNRNERRPEVQKYLEKHLPRTPKLKTRKGVISKTNKSGTPSRLMKISHRNQSRAVLNDHPILRYQHLTKSPVTPNYAGSTTYSTSQTTNHTSEKSRLYEFQSSPRRSCNMIHRKNAYLQKPVKEYVLHNIRKVAQELKELREKLNCLQSEGLVQNADGYSTKSNNIKHKSGNYEVLCPEA